MVRKPGAFAVVRNISIVCSNGETQTFPLVRLFPKKESYSKTTFCLFTYFYLFAVVSNSLPEYNFPWLPHGV